MVVLKISLTEDMLKLISNIRFQEVPQALQDDDEREMVTYGVDYGSLYGGNFVFEDISFILGRYDEHIPGTEEDALGAKFPKEFEDYMWEMHSYILEHIDCIEELVHQFCNKGGLQPGVYVAKPNEHIWKRKD